MPFDSTPQETKHDVFSLESLIAWLETKDPEEWYNPHNPFECMFTQYFTSKQVEFTGYPTSYTYGGVDLVHNKWSRIAFDGLDGKHTFGAALERARKLKEARDAV